MSSLCKTLDSDIGTFGSVIGIFSSIEIEFSTKCGGIAHCNGSLVAPHIALINRKCVFIGVGDCNLRCGEDAIVVGPQLKVVGCCRDSNYNCVLFAFGYGGNALDSALLLATCRVDCIELHVACKIVAGVVDSERKSLGTLVECFGSYKRE